MRKYILPSVLILLLGLGLGVAQNINKAIQLSQDPTGAFGVDTNNNAYFPAHILTTGPGTPTVTSCGTTPSITGTDFAGTITEGSTASTCTVTFAKPYLAKPYCVVYGQTAGTPIGYTLVTTSIQITNTSASGMLIDYICSGSK